MSPSPVTRYVAGFLFGQDENQIITRVLLIEKKRGPKHLIGRWNAIGGHIEDDESAAGAMDREFQEEVGYSVKPAWVPFCKLGGRGFELDFFYAVGPTYAATARTDERVDWWPLPIQAWPVVANLPWLIEMALSMVNKEERAQRFEITEFGTNQEDL